MIDNFAYCGLVCGLCREAGEKCRGCRNGGADADCYQRNCCIEKGIDGCWQCETFPCDRGYFGDEKWRGICLGFAHCIRAVGPEEFFGIVESTLGRELDYEDYLYRDVKDVVKMLCEGGMHED
ncbi:MAG: DUF3795 domain-containing protein [Deferribacteres bacterium]|nr:DUF3795 domain-containing protein [Deferribacteres bacterium]